MNVLHLTTHLNTGGITTYIYRLIEPLRQRGISLHVLSSGGDWEEKLRAEGAHIHRLAIRTKSELHPRLYLAIPKVAKVIRTCNIRLLHPHTRITQVMSYWLRKKMKIPVVTTCHGFYKRRLGRILIPAWGDRVIAISKMVGEHLELNHRVAPERIKLINNAVNIENLDLAFSRHDPRSVKSSYGFQPSDRVVGIISRIIEDKGHEYLIRAIASLQPSYPNLKVLVVGSGRYQAALEALIRELDLHRSVVFTGNVEDVTRPLAAMDIFTLPATWREGFGLSIIEAMACRKPIIVTNIWSLNSLIQDHISGLMVEPKSVPSLASAIAELIQNPELARRLTTFGREMVEDLFSIKRMADELASVYQELAPAAEMPEKTR